MSNVKKLMMTAASAGDALNVEDVFSTYLYTGNSKSQAIPNGLALGNGPTGENGSSTEFDGSTDWLTRSSDLSGNSNGKTFTFSFWVYVPEDLAYNRKVYHTGGSWRQTIYVSSSGSLIVAFYNNTSSGGTAFEIQAGNSITLGAWTHVLFSADLANSANSRLYIDDQLHPSPNFTHNNTTIDWTVTPHYIGYDGTGASTGRFKGNMAHFYFDQTYRDLDTESNRRYFINEAGGATSVATQSALNPILYLPMISGYSVGENEGTGGNFTANGTPTIVTDNGVEADEVTAQGGLVWIKNREASSSNHLYDTERGIRQRLISDSTNGTYSGPSGYGVTGFRSNGFTLHSHSAVNYNNFDFTSWSWRKAEKFFDIIEFTYANGSNTYSHNLGSTPGAIFIKRTDSSTGGDWWVWHRSVGNSNYLRLNENAAQSSYTNWCAPTSTNFTLANAFLVDGGEYIAYIFAHNNNDGVFGPTGDQDIIKCGYYTGNGSTNGPDVNIGFEPQWVMFKRYDSGDSWYILDNMRGWVDNTTGDKTLVANNTNQEQDLNSNWFGSQGPSLTATGFKLKGAALNGSSGKYAYIAVRRGPMAIPTSGTDVFNTSVQVGYDGNKGGYRSASGWPADMGIKFKSAGTGFSLATRLLQEFYLKTQRTDPKASDGEAMFDFMDGWQENATSTDMSWMWRRSPTFFDTVTYKGTGSAGHTINHSLGVEPEMIWVKAHSSGTSEGWNCYFKTLGNTYLLFLNKDFQALANDNYWNSTTPTSTQFTVGTYWGTNKSNTDFIAYLFATVDGISKVGSYTGNGSSQNIDCGFSSGARFIMIKRTDSSGDWTVFDSYNGIVAGNDPYMRLNLTSAQESGYDVVDPYSAGFTVNNQASLNLSGASYIFYAVA